MSNIANTKDNIKMNEKLIFFDVHASFIHSLVLLKGKCIHLHTAALKTLKENSQEILGNERTFYSDTSDVISCMIVYLVNEEISNMNERSYSFDILINASIKSSTHGIDRNEKYLIKIAHEDIRDIFIEKINEITTSYSLDFTISTFSAFEKWMCKIYQNVRKNTPSKGTKKKSWLD